MLHRDAANRATHGDETGNYRVIDETPSRIVNTQCVFIDTTQLSRSDGTTRHGTARGPAFGPSSYRWRWLALSDEFHSVGWRQNSWPGRQDEMRWRRIHQVSIFYMVGNGQWFHVHCPWVSFRLLLLLLVVVLYCDDNNGEHCCWRMLLDNKQRLSGVINSIIGKSPSLLIVLLDVATRAYHV